MLWVDTPTQQDLSSLNAHRADACVSIYLPTTPLTQDIEASRIAFRNQAKAAAQQLQDSGFDKRRLAALLAPLDDLAEDDEFWRFQANSLAVLATPETMRTFRLANKLTAQTEVSDRFLLKPLLRAVTFPHQAFILALSENAVRLIEMASDLPPAPVRVPDLPKDAASAVGKSTLNDRAPVGRIQGAEGQKVRFAQYARKVDAAIRPILSGTDVPLILAGTGALPSIFAGLCSLPNLQRETVATSPDRMSEAELAQSARPILDAAYARAIEDFHALYRTRLGEGRATADLAAAARAATYGAIQSLLVDIDNVIPGTIDEETGTVHLAERADANSYGVVDEIAGRALNAGGKVLAVRKSDIPGGADLAAILRYRM